MLVVAMFYRTQKIKFTKFLIEIDFIPVTGSDMQLESGGIITLFYIIFIASLCLVYMIRFMYYNELAEVIPISYISQTHAMKLSTILNVELVGYDGDCVDLDKLVRINGAEKFYGCSDEIEITRVDSFGKSIFPYKKISCSNDKLVIKIKKPSSYVQLFKWSFESIWAETFDKENGFSKIVGVFKPNDDLR